MAARRYYIDREHSKRNELKESFTIVELENIAQAARVIFERSFVLDDGDVTGCTVNMMFKISAKLFIFAFKNAHYT